jgi:hypothetical protein
MRDAAARKVHSKNGADAPHPVTTFREDVMDYG